MFNDVSRTHYRVGAMLQIYCCCRTAVLKKVSVVPSKLNISAQTGWTESYTWSIPGVVEATCIVESMVVFGCSDFAAHLDKFVTEDESRSLAMSHVREHNAYD
jgi:hypothetical protein